MQIIIPMSGFGERFRKAGYTVPKPLIEIEGKPIIAHVIDMFPGEQNFLFICNQEHLDNSSYRMEDVIKQYCPTGRIIGIAPHKLGPIHAVRQAETLIDRTKEVIINYCDFTCYWDWAHFKSFVSSTKCDGAIPAYRGFHPHTLGTTNYAYMREAGGWVLDIQEKCPFTEDRMQEYASSGTYYFSSGALMSEALAATMDNDLNVGGEYYVSLAYKHLIARQKRVAVYELQHFMQWGTPSDVNEYNRWSAAFRELIESAPSRQVSSGSVVIPMAGLGQRFSREGYDLPKPLIPVSGRPMVIQATNDLPQAKHYAFVLREDMQGFTSIAVELEASYKGAVIDTVPAVTEGQACTAALGVNALESSLGAISNPITFGACDNGALYSHTALAGLLQNPDVDVIVWSVRGHTNAIRKPEMFGWIDAEAGRIRKISVKTPLHDPSRDPVVIGTFTFKNADDFRRSVDRMISRNGRVNGEFYLDTCINDAIDLGLRCHLFEVDHYLSWGVPDDLRTFEYWQSCFHKWPSHPYRLEKDHRIPIDKVPALRARYQTIVPSLPEQ